MIAGQSFTADSQATKPMQPCAGSFDHPARLSQAAAVLGSASCDLGLKASGRDSSCAVCAAEEAVR